MFYKLETHVAVVVNCFANHKKRGTAILFSCLSMQSAARNHQVCSLELHQGSERS